MANPLLQHAYSDAPAAALTSVEAAVEAVGQAAGQAADAASQSLPQALSQSLPQAVSDPALQETGRNAMESVGTAAGQIAGQAANGMAGQDMLGGYFQALGAVFLLLAVLALAFWLLKRYGPKAGLRAFHRGDLQLESQLSLAPKRNITVVRFLNKRLVLGVTETQITLLTTVEADHAPENKDFSASLAKAQKSDSPD